MLYVEMRRVRRVLVWFAAILGGIIILALIGIFSAHGRNVISDAIPFSDILAIAAFAPCVVASFISTGLSAESPTLPILWTRPMARAQIAWRYFAIDFAGIIASYVIAVALGLIMLAILGFAHAVTLDVRSVAVFADVLAAALMLYALVQLIAARVGRAPAVVGCLWAAMVVAAAFNHITLPPLLHGIVYALNWLSPLAWLGSLSSHLDHATTTNGEPGVIPFAISWRALGAFCIALVALAAAVPLWSTKEA